MTAGGAGGGLRKFIFRFYIFRGILVGAKGLAGGLGGLGWKGGCPGNLVFNSKFPQARLGGVGNLGLRNLGLARV